MTDYIYESMKKRYFAYILSSILTFTFLSILLLVDIKIINKSHEIIHNTYLVTLGIFGLYILIYPFIFNKILAKKILKRVELENERTVR